MFLRLNERQIHQSSAPLNRAAWFRIQALYESCPVRSWHS